MSSQLVDTERRRLRVTRVGVLKNRSQSRQPAKKTPPLTSRRQLRVELPHFHNEIFPDSPAPTWQGVPCSGSLGKVPRQQSRDPNSRVSTGRRRLRVTRVAVVDPQLPDMLAPPKPVSRKTGNEAEASSQDWLKFIVRVIKPPKEKMLITLITVLAFSANWLNSPDATRLKNDPASRWASIQESYLKGKQVYWNNPAEFLWVWFIVEAGWMDNEP